jgi:hypothetical protein
MTMADRSWTQTKVGDWCSPVFWGRVWGRLVKKFALDLASLEPKTFGTGAQNLAP